jgi:hypothetical protein
MARKNSGGGFTIGELERLLKRGRSKIGKLEKKRTKVSRQLHAIDAEIASLGGSAGATRSGRPHNTQSLSEVIHQVLKDKGGAMRVAEIVEATLHAGYQTKSDNFRGIVNQTLIKDKRFAKSGVRGSYVLKK